MSEQSKYSSFLKNQFRDYRFDESIHLGLGDIRLTIGMQEEIVEEAEKQDAKLEEAVAALREWIDFARVEEMPVKVKHLMIAGMLEEMTDEEDNV